MIRPRTFLIRLYDSIKSGIKNVKDQSKLTIADVLRMTTKSRRLRASRKYAKGRADGMVVSFGTCQRLKKVSGISSGLPRGKKYYRAMALTGGVKLNRMQF